MSQPEILLIGAGGHSHACIDAIELQGLYRIAGLVGSADERAQLHLGHPVIGTDLDLPQLRQRYSRALISVGHIKSPELRIRLFERALELGFEMPVIVSTSAYVSRHARVGAGTLVMHGAVVNAGAEVGMNCILNSRALVEHDARVADHCHIATGAILNGSVTVGAGSFVGSGSVLRQGVTIGANCIVGMGLSVRHPQPAHTIFVGHA